MHRLAKLGVDHFPLTTIFPRSDDSTPGSSVAAGNVAVDIVERFKNLMWNQVTRHDVLPRP